jgi:cytochrome b561
MVVPAMIGDFPVLPGVEQRTIDAIYVFHKGLGAVLIVVVFARLIWRLFHRAPPWPDTMPAFEQRVATQTHWFLYFLMVLAVVTGYVHVVGLGFPMELLDYLGVPPLIPRMEAIAVASSFIHRFTVFVLVGVVGVHVAEVLRHHYVVKDGIMKRMWPIFGGDAEPAPPPAQPARETAVGAAPPR